MTNIETTRGPLAPTATGSVFKVLGSFIGGAIGTGVLILVFSAMSSVFRPVLEQDTGDTIAPIVLFMFMGMLFLSTLSANLVSTILMALSEKEKYKRISRTIFQAFLVNLVIFIGFAPLYLVITNINLELIASIAAIQVIMSVIASSMILEIVSNEQYGIVGVYTAVFGTIIGIGLNFLIFSTTEKTTLLVFTGFPLLWLSIALTNIVANLIYYNIYKVAGVDFLNTNEGKTDDLEEDEPDTAPITEEEVIQAREDKAGADFLKKDE